MTFEQTLILEFMAIVKWLIIGGGLVLLIGKTFKGGVDYLLKEMEGKPKKED